MSVCIILLPKYSNQHSPLKGRKPDNSAIVFVVMTNAVCTNEQGGWWVCPRQVSQYFVIDCDQVLPPVPNLKLCHLHQSPIKHVKKTYIFNDRSWLMFCARGLLNDRVGKEKNKLLFIL